MLDIVHGKDIPHAHPLKYSTSDVAVPVFGDQADVDQYDFFENKDEPNCPLKKCDFLMRDCKTHWYQYSVNEKNLPMIKRNTMVAGFIKQAGCYSCENSHGVRASIQLEDLT